VTRIHKGATALGIDSPSMLTYLAAYSPRNHLVAAWAIPAAFVSSFSVKYSL